MYFLKDKKSCSGCSACLNICPKSCISMKEDQEGFLYPYISDLDKCIHCKLCENICPINNKNTKAITPKAYACKNKDNSIRLKSSSGGVFNEIAEEILNNNGLVVGAMFDKDFNVYHGIAQNIEELSKIRGSKYVQSDMNNVFKSIRSSLNNNKEVLFSGTPCQIAGLKSFLRKDYINLLTIEVACHGVPSPMVFRKYKNYLSDKYESNITNFTFRSKEEGWTNYKIRADFENGQTFSEYGYENLYMKGFVGDLYIRPSCTECVFKNFSSGSDITLADYWGIDTKYKEFNDNKGISLVFVNTNQGRKIFDKIEKNLEVKNTDVEHGIKFNPCIIRSVKTHKKSKQFYKKLKTKDFDELVELCIKKRKETRLEYYIRATVNIIKGKLGLEIN